MDKRISSSISLAIILAIAIFITGFLWVSNYQENKAEQKESLIEKVETEKESKVCPMDAQPKPCPDGSYVNRGSDCEYAQCPMDRVGGDRDEHGCIGSAGYSWCEEKQKCLRSWEEKCGTASAKIKVDPNVQFDACGKKEKYQNLAWWNNFSKKINDINYFSENYILAGMNNDNYPGTFEEYCADTKYKENYLCKDRNLKLTIDNFDEYSEGCLAKDKSFFIVAIAGSYMGEGNHILMYDTKNNTLNEARKVNEQRGDAWFSPPAEFLERNGNHIEMHGRSGDAGVAVETWFDYNFVTNEVVMTKSCSTSDNSKGQPETNCEIIK
jgi:hypothetical protein